MAHQNRMSFLIAFLTVSLVFSLCVTADAQKKIMSLATGGTGGVYFPLGGGMANVLSKYIPNLDVTAEVTAASVDNLKLIHAKRVELAWALGVKPSSIVPINAVIARK